jgi:hypothetical protein
LSGSRYKTLRAACWTHLFQTVDRSFPPTGYLSIFNEVIAKNQPHLCGLTVEVTENLSLFSSLCDLRDGICLRCLRIIRGKKGWQNMTVTCQWAVSHPAVTTRNIYSSYVGCPNNTLSLLMTLKIYLNILLYIGLNLQILSSFCRYAVSHSLGYRYATHMDKTVTMKLSRSTYFFNRYCSLHISA